LPETFFRVGGAIVLDTLAFVVWNVGTRSPLELFVAMRDAVRRRRSLFAGFVSALIGIIFVAAATVLLLPAIAIPELDFVPAELFTLLVALVLEHLVGNDLRALAGAPGSTPG
jgi:hypothetical protein